MYKSIPQFSLVSALLLLLSSANGEEMKIGHSVNKHGMNIGAVYLQPVLMDPVHNASDEVADIHLEADISSSGDKASGFPKDNWVPYLGVNFELIKIGSDWMKKGEFIPMLANDGPHYGANVKLNGVGKYKVKYTISPPEHHGFHRHIDKETGVSEWWKPFELEWEFVYLGVGKKGGY